MLGICQSFIRKYQPLTCRERPILRYGVNELTIVLFNCIVLDYLLYMLMFSGPVPATFLWVKKDTEE